MGGWALKLLHKNLVLWTQILKNTPLIFITLTVVTLFTNNLISPLYINFEYQGCAFKCVNIIYLLMHVVMPFKAIVCLIQLIQLIHWR